MFNFLKTGKEFNNLAKSMNGMNAMIEDLIPKIERSYDHSEFTEVVSVLAYVARKGVLDRIEQYNWAMDTKIIVPTIDRERITLMYAFTQTVGKLHTIAAQLDLTELVEEIMEKEDAYYQLENILPPEITKNI